MAPSLYVEALLPLTGVRHGKALYVRDSGSDANGGSQSTTDAVDGAASTSAASTTVYIGTGAGVGGVILIAIVALAVQILRKRARHRRAITELEQQSEPVTTASVQEIREVPRPVSIARCGTLNPLHAKAGWGALSSDKTVYEPEPVRRKRNSASLRKRIRQRAIPLKRLRHLSAIMESPRSRTAKSPSPAMHELVTAMHEVVTATPSKSDATAGSGRKKTVHLVPPSENDEDVFVMPGSPKPHVLPSFAIGSPGMYGAAIANDERLRPPRSISVGALQIPVPNSAVFGHTSRPNRPQMHARSISLGAPQRHPPSGSVPPVPVIVASGREGSDDSHNRQGLCVSRMSSSSQESASSSVLVTSPLLKMHEDKPIGSPSVEEVVADDDSEQLKTVLNRQWQRPLVAGPQYAGASHKHTASTRARTSESAAWSRQHDFIRSTTARYSTSSQYRLSAASAVSSLEDSSQNDHRFSTASTVSSLSDAHTGNMNRLSIPQIGTAGRVSISRVSSFNSLKAAAAAAGGIGSHTSLTTGAVQKITTPRKPHRTSSVSANGSPAERRKTGVLRDISGNANPQLTPSRQASDSTVQTSWSGRSSNGNPFQWDQSLPLLKPSALKGSPNSKGSKGHKRQNCVRISTLQPQILGPPPSRPTSPSIMHGIEEEESAEGEDMRRVEWGMRFVRNEKLPRQPSASSLAANLRVKPVRVSLTPSSPTLSMWTAYQEQQHPGSALPSQHSDSQLSVSPLGTGRSAAGSRQSDRSSGGFSIPAFPSRSRATVGGLQLQQPILEFCLPRPSTDGPEEDASSRFVLHASYAHGGDEDSATHDDAVVLPSSPPLPVSKQDEYDPAWPMLAVPAPNDGMEYDPASPLWPPADTTSRSETTDLSSPCFLPFALSNSSAPAPEELSYNDAEHVSPRTRSRPTPYGGDLPDTPLCSARTKPGEEFQRFFETTRSQSPTSSVRSRPARPTAAEKLTSANASAIMATIPEVPPTVGFPSEVPILPPPTEDTVPNTTPTARRQRAASNDYQVSTFELLRPAPPPPPTKEENGDVPQPLHIKHPSTHSHSPSHSNASPQGPRSEPAKSVLRNAMALRRMNSEIDRTRSLNRESRHYVRLGREASPLLPWIGSPESCNDLFDFDFGDLLVDAGAGAEEDEDGEAGGGALGGRSALDDIAMSALDRRLDGALAGFDAGPPSSPPSATHEGDSKRESSFSVWEDGELFWEKQPRFSFAASSWLPSRSNADTTPVKKSAGAWEGYRDGSVTPVQRFRMPELEVERPSSIMKTPRSLYDSDGFLRT